MSAPLAAVRCFDVRNGRAVGTTPLTHAAPVTAIGLSQGGGPASGNLLERKLAFTDAANDMYISPIVRPSPVKLASMVDSFAWNEACDTLTALTDGSMVTWLAPAAVYVDAELATAAKLTGDAAVAASFGPLPQILSNSGSRITVRRGDGAHIAATVAVYPPLLYELVSTGKWEAAVRLARFVKSQPLWAALAALSLAAKHLDTAEVALAAVGDVDKLAFIQHVKELVRRCSTTMCNPTGAAE